MGKQLVNFYHLRLRVECTIFVIYKAVHESTSYFHVYVHSDVSTSQSFPHSICKHICKQLDCQIVRRIPRTSVQLTKKCSVV
jgi:uncharacterized membrane protein YesL